jgi:hypothetical protein
MGYTWQDAEPTPDAALPSTHLTRRKAKFLVNTLVVGDFSPSGVLLHGCPSR